MISASRAAHFAHRGDGAGGCLGSACWQRRWLVSWAVRRVSVCSGLQSARGRCRNLPEIFCRNTPKLERFQRTCIDVPTAEMSSEPYFSNGPNLLYFSCAFCNFGGQPGCNYALHNHESNFSITAISTTEFCTVPPTGGQLGPMCGRRGPLLGSPGSGVKSTI